MQSFDDGLKNCGGLALTKQEVHSVLVPVQVAQFIEDEHATIFKIDLYLLFIIAYKIHVYRYHILVSFDSRS